MATLENLVVKFTGDSSGLVTAARLGTRAVKQIGRATAALAKVGAAGAVGLAVAAGAFVQSSRRQIDETRKLAANLRQTVAETQKLALVGELTGTNLQTMSIAVQQATRAVGDAQGGSKAAKDAIEALGLKVSDLSKQSASARFETIIGALGKVQDKTVQASIAAILLGRGWRTMNVLIEDGGAAFARAQDVIVGLGLGLKETDTTTEQLNDQLATLTTIGIALKNKVFEALAPLMLPFVDNLVKLAESAIIAAGGGQQLADAWAGEIVNAIQKTAQFFNNLVTVVRTAWGIISPIIEEMTDGMAKVAAIAEGFSSGGLQGGASAIQATNFGESFVPTDLLAAFSPGGALLRGLFGGDGAETAGGTDVAKVQEEQLTEQQQQTQLLREISDNVFTNVAVAG